MYAHLICQRSLTIWCLSLLFPLISGDNMNKPLSRRLRVLAIALFFTGVVSAVIAYALPMKGPKTRPAKGFTIVTKEAIRLNDPKAQANPLQSDYVVTVRSQKPDGTLEGGPHCLQK